MPLADARARTSFVTTQSLDIVTHRRQVLQRLKGARSCLSRLLLMRCLVTWRSALLGVQDWSFVGYFLGRREAQLRLDVALHLRVFYQAGTALRRSLRADRSQGVSRNLT